MASSLVLGLGWSPWRIRWHLWQRATRLSSAQLAGVWSRWSTVSTWGGGPWGASQATQRQPAASFTRVAMAFQLSG